MQEYSWSDVIDRPSDRLEFGACHINMAWRRHKSDSHSFHGLHTAFVSSAHRLPLLLQSVDSNYNARNHPDRGQALFAAVWFSDTPWAILCSPTHATLVARDAIEAFSEKSTRDDSITEALRQLFNSSPSRTRIPLDDSFYVEGIARHQDIFRT